MSIDINNLILFEDNTQMKLRTNLTTGYELADKVTTFIKKAFSIKNIRDSLIFSIDIYGCQMKIEVDYIQDVVDKFISEIKNCIDDEDEISLECTFFKNIVENSISVYSMEKYGQYIESLSIESALGKYYELYKDYGYIVFDLILDVGCFYTKKFYFLDSENKRSTYFSINRDEIINKRDNLCNFVGEKKITFVPDDFYFLKKPNNTRIQRVFEKLTLAVSLIYISNISNIKNNILTYKIEGYKTVRDEFEVRLLDDCSEAASSLWETYDWIYANLNNVSDKIGIARNILSLNLSNTEIISINSSIVASIRSGYEIYLKENAERYIDVMNQQLIFINEINSSIQGLASDFSHKFRNNFIGFFSFVFTTMIFNIISTGTINNIFTYEITMICAVLLIISIVYLIFSLIEATLSAKKIKQKYDRNKSFYKLILDEQDLARILDNDNYYNEDKQYLKNYVKTYAGLWIIVVVILSIFLKYVGTFIK